MSWDELTCRELDINREDADDYEREINCKFCGKGGLVWSTAGNGWRLFDPETKVLHTCEKWRKS